MRLGAVAQDVKWVDWRDSANMLFDIRLSLLTISNQYRVQKIW